MSNRKSSATGNAGDGTANAQENLNALYTAHQVHTLANMIYRQMAGGANAGWNAGAPAGNAAAQWMFPGASPMQAPPGFMPPAWAMPGSAAMAAPQAPSCPTTGGAGFAAPPALFYWYP